MDSFIIIIILYIILYIILSVINVINQRKKRELLKQKREEEPFEEEKTILPPPFEKIKIEEKGEGLLEEFKEPEKIEIYETKPEETKKQEEIKPEKEKIIIEEIQPYEKIPKIKKILSFSKNDILKGIIFKEIVTPKFKK